LQIFHDIYVHGNITHFWRLQYSLDLIQKRYTANNNFLSKLLPLIKDDIELQIFLFVMLHEEIYSSDLIQNTFVYYIINFFINSNSDSAIITKITQLLLTELNLSIPKYSNNRSLHPKLAELISKYTTLLKTHNLEYT
jgi:hypothetical protein